MSTALYRSFQINVAFFSLAEVGGCQQKQKKSIDQRAPQILYEGIKSLRSLAMKNYLVTGGLLSLVESYDNKEYKGFQWRKATLKVSLLFALITGMNCDLFCKSCLVSLLSSEVLSEGSRFNFLIV